MTRSDHHGSVGRIWISRPPFTWATRPRSTTARAAVADSACGGYLDARLKMAGWFLQFPGHNKAGHWKMPNFFLSPLRAVGDNREKLGAGDCGLADIDTRKPLAELLA
jgi:hypothetical protein